jgi:hypothetical protein
MKYQAKGAYFKFQRIFKYKGPVICKLLLPPTLVKLAPNQPECYN